MSKQKKLIKKLSVLFVMLILTVTVLSATAASAAATNRNFNFDIPAGGELCHSKYSYYRNTSSVQNGWGLNFEYSSERANYPHTATKFWLGIDNPDGINPLGSQKFTVTEASGWHSYPAYNKANRENVFYMLLTILIQTKNILHQDNGLQIAENRLKNKLLYSPLSILQ